MKHPLPDFTVSADRSLTYRHGIEQTQNPIQQGAIPMKKLSLLKKTIVVAAACFALLLFASNGQAQPQFSFAALGDVPYEPVSNGSQVYPIPQYERLIADINSDPSIEFTVHIGDI
jgi:hypothetical protein